MRLRVAVQQFIRAGSVSRVGLVHTTYVKDGGKMATEGTRDSWYWPKITNIADAAKASDQGFWAAVLVAGITTVIATITVFSGREIAAINPYAYIDAALFALIAWRIRRRSRAFAVVGLVLFLFEKIHQFSVEPQIASVGAIMAIFFVLLFINGIRGTFAFHRLAQKSLGSTLQQDV